MNPPQDVNLALRLLEESALTSSHAPIGVGLLRTLLEKHYQISGDLELVAGEKGDTFILRTGSSNYLLKVSSPDEPEEVVAFQTAMMRSLEYCEPALPIQRVKLTVAGCDNVAIEMTDGTRRLLRLFNFIEGPLWAQTNPSAEQLVKLGELLGRMDVKLQSFAHTGDGRRLVYDIRHFHHMSRLVEYLPKAQHRLLAQRVFQLFGDVVVPRLSDLESQVIHGDYSPYNVVVDPQSQAFVKGVIDFGDAVRSAVIFDPANSVAHLLGRDQSQPWGDACIFVAGYHKARQINDLELHLLPVAALARLALFALTMNWRSGRAPDRRDYLLNRSEAFMINLERALAVPMDDVLASFRSAS